MNSLEFLAQNIGVLGLLQRGVKNTAIKARGDNLTALAWGRDRRYRWVHQGDLRTAGNAVRG
jgi:hypothetical protein